MKFWHIFNPCRNHRDRDFKKGVLVDGAEHKADKGGRDIAAKNIAAALPMWIPKCPH